MKKILSMLLASVMVLSLAACATKGGDKMDGMSSEPKNAEEAVAMHKELMAQENAILSENTALWEKVFIAADKGMTMQEDGKNYGEFLLDTIEGSKDQFTEDELKLLKEAAEESGLCEELFRSFDERPKSFLYSIAMDPYSFSMNHVTPKGSIEQQVYLATYDTIKKLADKSLRPDRPLRGLRAQGSRRRHQSLHHGSARKPHQARCRPQRHQRERGKRPHQEDG